jgi:hypothetical protein
MRLLLKGAYCANVSNDKLTRLLNSPRALI